MAQSGQASSQSTQPEQKPPFLPKAELPSGGGAVRGIGEKVSVNPARGTCSLQLPVFTSPGRSGFGPALSLGYDSGGGNSPFGMGWGMAIPAIARKTDKGLPHYTDADTFVLAGSEDLVPSEESLPDETIDGVVYQVRRYRPRIQAAFTRIERCRSTDGDVFWRTVSKDNVRSVFGRTARIADPADPARVFQWLLEEVRDDRGNVATYEYAEEPAPVDDAVWERNRLGTAQPQRYLHRIRYCDHFLVELEYESRPDPFSSCRPGFEVRTWQRCHKIAMYHDFSEEFGPTTSGGAGGGDGGPNPRLIRSTDLSYDDDPAGCHLIAVTQTGYLWTGTEYAAESLPPVQYEYTRSQAEDAVRVITAENLPSGVDNQRYHWVDLDGEGLPGALTQQGGAWFYKRNLGGGRLGAMERVPLHPSLAGGEGAAPGEPLALLDLAGDGSRALVRTGPAMHGYQERSATGWAPFTPWSARATVAWDDPALKQADLDGDGRADLLFLHGEELLHHESLGRDGFGPQLRTLLGSDEERGPVLLSADASESIMLADMSGDGLADLVRVRNGSVCYWPNLGRGRFGRKVTMAGAPLFDSAELFEPSRLRTADIDGSGTTDLLYLGRDKVRFWINQSGNGFAEPVALAAFPDTDDLSTVDVVDLLGTGTSCLVWSSAGARDRESPLRYVDLSRAVSDWLPEAEAAGHKPHLLCQVSNNLGGQIRLVYAPSTSYYLADKAAGEPWATRLHFPVQVMSRMESFDHIAKTRLTSSYRYRHGYFDAAEREYRGFGMVEQTDAETFPLFDELSARAARAEAGETELHRPPARTRSWFHLGAAVGWAGDYNAIDAPLQDSVLPPGLRPREQREALRALAGLPLRTEVYADDGAPNAQVPYSVTEHRYRVELVASADGAGHAVFRQHLLETLAHHYERDPADPRVKHDIVLEVDEFNVPLRAVSIGYPRRHPQLPEQEQLAVLRTVAEVAHVTSGASYRLGLPVQTRTYAVTGLTPAGNRFTVSEADQPGTQQLVEQVRTRYWNDSLTAESPAGQVGERALVHQTYKIAFTPTAVADRYGGRVDDALLAEGGYVPADGAWWIPSGVRHYDPSAFYLPVKLVGAFGNESSVEYDPYRLLPVTSRASATAPFDALVTEVVNDYRLLGPVRITDPNGNGSRADFDALGRVTATWVQGKDGAGDPDDLPGAEFSFHTTSLPTWTEGRTRERHGDPASPWQPARAYSDGTGRVIMTKQQAEPDTGGLPRWVGSGRVVYDNKGQPVKQYEPYFSATAGYEDEPEIVAQGVTAILHYDPIGRPVRTDYPDGTFTRVVISAWESESWDANDTVLDSLWYAERGAPDPDGEPEPADPDRRAAWLAARHAGTPAVSRMDSFGRAVRSVADAGPAGLLETITELDIEGNVRSVTDPRGIVVQTSQYDLAGRAVFRHSPDAGDRWTLPDIAGHPIRVWDARGHVHEFEFDALRRPTRTWVTLPSAERKLVQASWYGEDHPAAVPRNLLERPVIRLDGSGITHSVEFDFKGNLLIARHRLTAEYQQTPDWAALATASVSTVENDADALGLLDNELYQTGTHFDALDREISNVLPDGSIITPSYNEGGVLESIQANPIGVGQDEFYVRELDYDAKGQRQLIVYGNFLRTRYGYDPLNYRLTRLETFRSGAPGDRLQDLHYTYDAAGNITEIRDEAQQTHFYAGQVVSPSARYEYDPLYRLSAATGREHDSLGNQPDQVEPGFGKPIPHPNDAAKIRLYRQSYAYDASGNLTQVKHVAVGNPAASWTRDHSHAGDSNRLLAHTRPGDSVPGSAAFGYDPHGNMTAMPHLPGPLAWDYADQLGTVPLLGGGTGYYAYDSAGDRARKVLHRNGGLVEERVYLGDYEIHRRSLNGTEIFRRTTLHVMDDKRRIAMIEHKTKDGSPSNEVRARYQLDNHLGSCSLEVDDSPAALLVSYEEYHPYGTTSLWLGAGNVEASERRYRYTGKEKDEETGLYYHGARYYSSWLGRWIAADPAGLTGGTCVYAYCSGNPVMLHDPSGTQDTPPPGLITNDPRIGALWEQAVVEELGPRYGVQTYPEVVTEFQRRTAERIAENGMGSNRQAGTGIHFARRTYSRVRSRFGRLARASGISLQAIQVHHTFAELARAPAEALTTTNLSAQRGNAGTVGSGHNFAHEVNRAHEAGVENPGQHVRADLEARGVTPDVPELGPAHPPDAPRVSAPDAPSTPRTPHTPDTPRAPRGRRGGGIVGRVIAVGIAVYVLVDTGDAVAAAQTANPAASTTQELVLQEGEATPEGTASAVASDVYGLTPMATADFVFFELLGPSGMAAEYFEEQYGPPVYDQQLADRAIQEGRNPFCAQCHGPGGALDPAAQDRSRLEFTFPETTAEDRQRLLDFVRATQSR